MNDLKPCPFCGGKAEVWYDDEMSAYRVGCEDHFLDHCFNDEPDEARSTWNQRV
tara:strand:- start:586 stop:747 length:162 start_codon:yes stop_codon:yes gene_type:complete